MAKIQRVSERCTAHNFIGIFLEFDFGKFTFTSNSYYLYSQYLHERFTFISTSRINFSVMG